jgi:hypothetical protein
MYSSKKGNGNLPKFQFNPLQLLTWKQQSISKSTKFVSSMG